MKDSMHAFARGSTVILLRRVFGTRSPRPDAIQCHLLIQQTGLQHYTKAVITFKAVLKNRLKYVLGVGMKMNRIFLTVSSK
jgi:hypothetical protein